MAVVEEHGGAVEAVPYMKAALVESHRERIAAHRVGRADRRRHRTASPRPSPRRSPPTPTAASWSSTPRSRPSSVEARARAGARRATRRPSTRRSPSSRAWPREHDENIMPATIAAARAGATTGEWAQTLRDVFGEYRAPTGVGEAAAGAGDDDARGLRDEVERVSRGARPPAEDPRRQARPRRALQRRRADRRARARRRHGRRLRGHPPDAVADRRLGARRRAST